jgi:hypothetical protein
VLRARVLRRDCDVAEEAEAHRAIAQRVMPGRSHRAKAPRALGEREVDGIEDAPGPGARRVPRAFADDGVAVESPTARERSVADERDVGRVVREREIVGGGVPPLEMPNGVKELRLLAERARNRPQTTDMLGMAPPGVVPPAVRVGDERDVAQARDLTARGGDAGTRRGRSTRRSRPRRRAKPPR